MLRALLFDFNGVIVDDEPLHFRTFQRVFQEEHIPLAEAEYYARYLPMDDHSLVKAVYRDLERPLGAEELAGLVERKSRYYGAAMREGVRIFPGAPEFVRRAAGLYPLAVASGAAREEIEFILDAAHLREHFVAIVAAEDVAKGKPDPECFTKALAALNEARRLQQGPIPPEEALVVEDSPAGVRGAKAAGMRCLAITNSVSADRLQEADRVVPTLAGLDPRELEW